MFNVKRQHYVPQFLLRRFVGEDGKLRVFNRGNGLSYNASPKDVACQRYYNAVELDTGCIDTQTIEKELSQIEGSGSAVIKLLLLGTTPTPEQRDEFALFLTSQDFRSPRRRQEFADMLLGIEHQKFSKSTMISVENYIQKVTKASEEEKELDFKELSAKSKLIVDDDGTVSVGFKGTIHALSAAKYFAPVVSKMDWNLFRAPQGNSYVICDSPVQLYESSETLEKYNGPAYWRKGSYISIPLSPDACLVASHPNRTGAIKWPPNFTITKATGADVRFFNNLQLLGCLKQIYASSDFSWLDKKSAELAEYSSQLSFLPIDAAGERITIKTNR